LREFGELESAAPGAGEAATALVVERASDAAARGARPLARIAWSSAPRSVEALAEELPDPTEDGLIVASPHVDARAVVAGTSWVGRPVLVPTRSAGRHAALGGLGLVAAASLVAAGRATRVLAIGGVAGRAYAFVLERAESA